MITEASVSIGTTATLIVTAVGKTELTFRVGPSSDVYLGGSNVSVSNGFLVGGAASPNGPSIGYKLVLCDGDSLYGIGSGSVTYIAKS